MSHTCPFCQQATPLQIELSELNLRICPHCHSTFMPSSQYAAVRRNVFVETRKLWLQVLETRTPALTLPPTVVCIDHGEPLQQGEIPDYGFPGVYPTCCDMQHLPPATMIEILKFGLKISESGFESQRSRNQPKGLAALLGGILFRWVEKANVEDGLDTMQYNFKFREALGPLPGEENSGI